MKRFGFVILIVAAMVLVSCESEPEMTVLDEYESADLAARAWSFQVYPGAEFLPSYTDAFRRSHSLMNPESPEPPPIAVYETSDPVETVARFYAEKYGYAAVAASRESSEAAPPAYFTSGDLGVDTRQIGDLLKRLGFAHDLTDLSGSWSGAHIAPTGPYPRVTIQRPYFDLESGEVRDKTLILMVRE